MSNEQFSYDPKIHETVIGHNYSLKMLNMGNAEVPMILKSWYPFRETENPEYRLKTDNRFLQLDFIFDNQEDADTLYNLLKKGTLKRVQRLTGRFKENEHLTNTHNRVKLVYPDHVRGKVSK